jgi:hypothetical protein
MTSHFLLIAPERRSSSARYPAALGTGDGSI